MIATCTMMEAPNQDPYRTPHLAEPSGTPSETNRSLDFGWNNFSDDTKMRNPDFDFNNNGRAARMGVLGLTVHQNLENVDNLLSPHF